MRVQLVSSIRQLTRQADAIETELRALVRAHSPRVLAETGCGVLTAATPIGRIAGADASRPKRASPTRPAPLRSPPHPAIATGTACTAAADRQLNRALHTIAITRARLDADTRAYIQRKLAEGKTRREAIRCLKRHLARRFYRPLTQPQDKPPAIPIKTLSHIPCLT